MEDLLNRFIRYVRIDSQSDSSSASCPSTTGQLKLGRLLARELQGMGLHEVQLDDNGYVRASLPANADSPCPVIAFIAHMDTSPDVSGNQVRPQIAPHYNGEDIILNQEKNITLSPRDFPELLNYKGQTVVTTDGTTLLGADDKAGVAEIMNALEWLCHNPQYRHGAIKIVFTPDEEIGRGVDYFKPDKLGADFAYTIDGGELGELEYENFNAASATVFIQGRNVHPGSAKNTMLNSLLIGMELNALLPVNERPEFSCGREGFFHLTDMAGTVEQTHMNYIIRDFDREQFAFKKDLLQKAVYFLNQKYDGNIITVEIKDQYYNMREKIEPVMHVVDLAARSIQLLGIAPKISPIRGGTDGARLSYMGLPCPNLFTGGHNYHSKFEYVILESMQEAVKMILKIIELTWQDNK